MNKLCLFSHPRPLGLAGLIILVLATVWGCGLKSNPKPLPPPQEAAIRDFILEKKGDETILRWRVTANPALGSHFHIERRAVDDYCPTCPSPYETIVRQPVASARSTGPGSYMFVDRPPPSRGGWRWRISLCRDSGVCGPAIMGD